MAKRSAGILMYRGSPQALELLLVHPGGPLWANKDDGAWSIPKGEYDDGEDPLAVAIREFTEELGASSDQRADQVSQSRRDRAAERQAGHRLRGRRRLRSGHAHVESVRAGMAAEQRADAILSRGRPRAVVRPRRGPARKSCPARRRSSTGCSNASAVSGLRHTIWLAQTAKIPHWRLRLPSGSSIF